MSDDCLSISVKPAAPGVVAVTVSIVSWNESSLTKIREAVLVPFGLEDINVQPVKFPTKPMEVRITNSRDCIIAFGTTMPDADAAEFCRALVSAAMDRFMSLNLTPGAVAAIGGMDYFEGTRYGVEG